MPDRVMRQVFLDFLRMSDGFLWRRWPPPCVRDAEGRPEGAGRPSHSEGRRSASEPRRRLLQNSLYRHPGMPVSSTVKG